jgi:heme exporter protein D
MTTSEVAGEYLWLAFVALLLGLSVWLVVHAIRSYLRRYD